MTAHGPERRRRATPAGLLDRGGHRSVLRGMSSSSLQHIRLGQGLGQPPGDLAQLVAGATAGRILAHGQAQSVRVAPRGAVGCGLFGSTSSRRDRERQRDRHRTRNAACASVHVDSEALISWSALHRPRLSPRDRGRPGRRPWPPSGRLRPGGRVDDDEGRRPGSAAARRSPAKPPRQHRAGVPVPPPAANGASAPSAPAQELSRRLRILGAREIP